MLDMNKVLKEAIKEDASDIHLIYGLKPIMRVSRELKQMEEHDVLDLDELYAAYDFFVRGKVEKDEIYKETKKLDTSYEFENVRLRVNISSADDMPIFTMRIIKNTLPKFEELGVPDIVRRMTLQPQGLILVTGKTNSGKTTTLNALINEINENQNKKILTLEKPIEYKQRGASDVIIWMVIFAWL